MVRRDELLDSEVGGWRILVKVGQGATGSVYEARREKRRAALKVIRPHVVSPESVERFRREARLLMEVQHPHVVRCIGAGETDEFVYMVLEFMDGGSLDRLLKRRGKFGLDEAIGVARALLKGLAAIHEKGILHRDVKPGNVLLDRQGGVKLADFNLARSDSIDHDVTTTGTIIGTPYYMAPEQVKGKDIGNPVDLYATGALLFHMVAGRPVFEGTSPLQILQKHLNSDPPELRELVPEVPEQLEQAVQQMLAKDPAERPASAEEALALLEGLPSATLQLPQLRRRRPARGKGGARGRATSGRRRPDPRSASSDSRSASNFHMERTHAMDPAAASRMRRDIDERSSSTRDTDRQPMVEDLPEEGPGEQKAAPPAPRHTFGKPAPLPRVPRSKLLDLVTLLLVALAAVCLLPAGILARLNQAVGPEAAKVIEAIRAAWGPVPVFAWLPFVAFLLFDRILAFLLRVGILGRIVLRHRANRLVEQGAFHQAAQVFEQLGQRLKAAQLLLDNGEALLAAEFFTRAGRTVMGDEPTFRPENDPKLAKQKASELLAAGEPFQAADMLERAGDLAGAAEALEAGYNNKQADKYYEHIGQEGTPAEAPARLSRRIAKLHMELDERRWAAIYFERGGEYDRAAELFAEVGDERGRARCLVMKIPRRGKLTSEQRAVAEEASEVLADLKDPRAVSLLARLGRWGDAGVLCRDLADYPQAAQFFARAGRQEEGAMCAERAGNRQLAAHLYEEAGLFARASVLYRQLGQLEAAAAAAGKCGDRERMAEILEEGGDSLGAAKALSDMGQPERALELLQRVPKNGPAWTKARVLAGELHHKAGDHEKAAAAYKDGLADQVRVLEDVGPNLRYAASLEALDWLIEALSVLDRFRGSKLAPPDLPKRRKALQVKTKTLTTRAPRSKPPARRQRPGRPARRKPAATRPASRPAPARHDDPLQLEGRSWDEYDLVKFLGQSPLVWVFQARGPRGIGAQVKVLRPELATGRAPDDFLAGGLALVGVGSPHLVQVLGGGAAEGLHYLAHEELKAPNLTTFLASEAPLAVQRAVRLGAGILSAIGLAHERDVLHLDLRPAKVFVAPGSLAKVADFGVAQAVADDVPPHQYLDPRFAAPEQARGEPAGHEVDQYTAGLLIYKMLSGKLPFQSKTPDGFWDLHAGARPTHLQELAPHVPPDLADAVMRALDKEPDRRFPSIVEFEKVLAGFVRGGRESDRHAVTER